MHWRILENFNLFVIVLTVVIARILSRLSNIFKVMAHKKLEQ